MMQRTDRHFRWLARRLTRRALLYTEMVSARAIVDGAAERDLEFDPVELPLVLQIGGSEPEVLARCAKRAESAGFTEIDLNCGCPSPDVKCGGFGAVLMKDPGLVARCVEAMRSACALPVTVKHRLGVDDVDGFEALTEFVGRVREAGAVRCIVHARKAWLKGLSPKENRTVPPLRYDWVHRLAEDHAGFPIEINGGIVSVDEARAQLETGRIAGVMIGRAAYDDPWMLRRVDSEIFGERPVPVEVVDVIEAMAQYVDRWVARGGRATAVTRHLAGLLKGMAGAKVFRRHLSEHAHRPGADGDVIRRALERAGGRWNVAPSPSTSLQT